jgi:outer membrane protein assembly factor BamA
MIKRGAVIGEIYIQAGDIFNSEEPGEDRFLFRLANRIHTTTRSTTVERKLLFHPGDPYDPRVLKETARYLRSLGYIYDATVEPIRYHANRVDIAVRTRDVWTLNAGAGLKRSGGENTFQAQLEESNFLGTGRLLDLKYVDNPDRSSSRLRFVDDALFGSRFELRLWYADNSDGYRRIFDLERPFFSLDTQWSGAVKALSDMRRERIYIQGRIRHRFGHEKTFAEVRAGISKGFVNKSTRRWHLGYTYEEDRFFKDRDSNPDFDIPQDRRHSYVWIGFEQVEDGFVETQNLDQLNRVEDLNLGREVHARLGFSSTALGGDGNKAIFSASLHYGWALPSGQNLFVDGWTSGRWGEDGEENTLLGTEWRYYIQNFGHHRLRVSFRGDIAFNLDPESQLLLGGSNGLRGYSRNFQNGTRRLLVSIEQRFYTKWELFKLINVGAAAFFDAGRAWHDSGNLRGNDLGVLRDVGLGLRLSSSRSSKGQMVHLDVAFPLDGGRNEVQWLISSRRSF